MLVWPLSQGPQDTLAHSDDVFGGCHSLSQEQFLIADLRSHPGKALPPGDRTGMTAPFREAGSLMVEVAPVPWLGLEINVNLNQSLSFPVSKTLSDAK